MPDPSVSLVRHDSNFRRYWAGQTVSGVGSQVTAFALPLVTALALHGGPREVGLVATAGMLPYLLLSLVAGHLLEGRDRRRVMVVASLAQATLIAAIPAAWAAGLLSVPLLAVLAFGSGCAALCFGVVGFSYVPALVRPADLAAANRAVQGSRTVAEVAGPGLAGLLVGLLGAPVATIVDALSYLASAVGVATSRPRAEAAARPEPERADSGLLEGVRVLVANRSLRALTAHATLYNLAEEVFVLNLVLWAVQRQGVTTAAYGAAMSAAGVGGLVGTLSALVVSRRLGLGRAYAGSLLLFCVVPLAVVAWPLRGGTLAWVITAVMLVAGIGLGQANVYSLTLRQQTIPRDQLTRSAGAYTQFSQGSVAIGALAAGLLGASWGTRAAAAAGVVGMIVSALPMLTRSFLSLRETAHEEKERADRLSDSEPRPDERVETSTTQQKVTQR